MDEARVTFCGQGEANSGFKAARMGFCPLCHPPHHGKGKRILSGLLKWRGKALEYLSFACQSWVLGNNRAFVTGAAQGAACPLLAKPPIWELQFYLGIAQERKTHFWVLQEVFLPEHRWSAEAQLPSDHPPPPHSQRLFSRWCLWDTSAWPGTKSNLGTGKT